MGEKNMNENKYNVSLQEMSIEELQELIRQVSRVLEDKTIRRQSEAMGKIREAMMAYCQEFGTINFEFCGSEYMDVDARYMIFETDTIYYD
jgi:Glu-tRNA(Gln) amidotransferase subunit E-like FAD-binding protein